MTCFIPRAESPLDPHINYSNILLLNKPPPPNSSASIRVSTSFPLMLLTQAGRLESHCNLKTSKAIQRKLGRNPAKTAPFFRHVDHSKPIKKGKTIERPSSQLVPFGVFASPPPVSDFNSDFFDAKQQNHHNIQRSSSTLTGPTFRRISRERTFSKFWGQIAPGISREFLRGDFPY